MKPETFLLAPSSQETRLGQLYGSSLSLALAEYCSKTPGIKLLITRDNLTANQLMAEIPFFFTDKQQDILLFSDWETLPYDQFSPHQDLISERLLTLNTMQQLQEGIVIASISTLMHRLCPSSFLNQYALSLKDGQSLQLESFRNQLIEAGYCAVHKVIEHGEFSVRGGILDLYPMGSTCPFRIELFDDTIESLREFDPETQRTIHRIQSIHILPAREFPLNETSKSLFRRAFREQFPGNPSLCPIYEAVSLNQFPSGIEYYLPLFFEKTMTFFDYLKVNSHVCMVENIRDEAYQFWTEINTRFEQQRFDVSRPILPPETLFIKPDKLLALANTYNPKRFFHEPVEKKGAVHNFSIQPGPKLPIERKSQESLLALKNYCETKNKRILLVVENAGRREVLLDLLKISGLHPKVQQNWQDFIQDTSPINITIGQLQQGFELQNAGIHLVVESQLFGEKRIPQQRSTSKAMAPELAIQSMAELDIGAAVVHLQFGVGRYQGLEYIEHNGLLNEFLILVYANDDKIYVPVTSLHLISRYTGSDNEHAPLHKLGTDKWQKDKKKAEEKIHDVAVELLEIYAKREAKPGHVYKLVKEDYQQFAEAFPFTETQDQLVAIEQIIGDMQSSRPMDRLICGDVGFGKTEVAMRAAFIAVQNNKQVCVVVPTTLLAGQHYDSFCDRFAEFAVNIQLLSRFKSGKESKEVVEGLVSGKVDIVIGTHKLFQKSIAFNNLGLLIIDEEHRFGVKQKEQLKAMRTNVDVLSMTATPIPRTLNMAMAGIRDISLITTAPAKRLAIKTFWHEKQDNLIRDAILREILRGGQVFFLHNNVQTIETVAEELRHLVPEAKVSIAHGQMRERELERIMSDFYHNRFNVLVCTTIIETGIDIPTANTILINRADTFGLAQLHQLRGRVGRSHHQAYAYLLTPHQKLMTSDAVKRLEAIVSMEDLGAGFTLATHDLEIRGAGELLGEEQSGNMHAIGFTLFMELLDRAISDLKAGRLPEFSNKPRDVSEIDLHMSAIIPESYVQDIHTRLVLYKRIAQAKDVDALDSLQVELIDRFGLLPASVKLLFLITELKFKATPMGIKRISAHSDKAKIEFQQNPVINHAALINLIQVHSKRYQMDGPLSLRFGLLETENQAKIQEIGDLLLKLM